jgi:2-polyprenyl-6-hydroxyphenyl methylase/3-demethylubiquinone-9 3-methyltransferase
MTEKIVDGAQFHEDLASSWSSGYSSGGFGRRLQVIISLLEDMVLPESNWLDAGCGTGLLTREICKMGAKATGVDASPRMISAAQSESTSESQLISFQQVKSIERIDVPSDAFDGILCSSVVEYVESPVDVFMEFSRVLTPDGKLLVSVPNKKSLVRNMQKLCNHVTGLWGGKAFPYLDVSKREFTRAEIDATLREAGISADSMEIFDPLLPGLFSRFGLGSLIIVSAHQQNSGLGHI